MTCPSLTVSPSLTSSCTTRPAILELISISLASARPQASACTSFFEPHPNAVIAASATTARQQARRYFTIASLNIKNPPHSVDRFILQYPGPFNKDPADIIDDRIDF